MNEYQEAELLMALEAIEQSWTNDWDKFSDSDRAEQLKHAAAVAEGKSDYSGFAESTQLGRVKQTWLN
jgi:hypothetical protein